MSEHKGLILRGSMLRAVTLFVNIAVAFYMMPFIIHSIGDRWYGMWTLVATFIGYYGYLDFGLSISTQRFIAGAIGRKDEDEINKLVTTSFFLFIAFGIVSLAITLLIAFCAPLFFTDPIEIRTFQTVLLILGLNVVFTLAMAPINGLMTGHLRFDLTTYINLGKLIIRTVLIVYFIKAGYSIIALAVISLLADSGGNIAKILIARKIFSGIRIQRRFYVRERIGELFAYGGKTFVNQIADLLRFQVDHLVIAAFIHLSAVTLFNVASQLVYYLRTLVEAFMGVLVPVFARYQAAQDKAAVTRVYYFTSKLSAGISVLLGGAMIIFGKVFITLWMGPAYVDAYALVVVLSIPTMLFIAQQPAIAMMYGLGAVGPLAKVSVIEAVSNLVLSLILVGPYGLTGVALGTAIPLTFFSFFLVVYSGRLAAGSLWEYFRHVGPVFLVGAVLQAVAWFIVSRVAITGYIDILLLLLAIYPVLLLVMMYLTFSSRELRLIRETGQRALGMA